MRPTPVVRPAVAADAPTVVRTLVAAFHADPPLRWLLRKDEKREDAFRAFFDLMFREMTLPFGGARMTEDGAGVALWTPPGKWQVGLFTQARLALPFARILGWSSLATKAIAINRLQSRHPRAPHHYLFAIGVDPEKQGRGVGNALLAEGLARCDAERSAAYLEASTQDSKRLYERFGFEVTEELVMGRGAPPLWLMWRSPR